MSTEHISPELEQQIALEIAHVARSLARRSTKAMENMNIGAGQLPILMVLSEAGTLTQRQLAERIRVTPATICGTMKRMERSGLIHREPSAEDARASLVSLTEEGKRRSCEALQLIKMPYEDMLSGFNEEECRLIRDLFHRMGENLSGAQEE